MAKTEPTKYKLTSLMCDIDDNTDLVCPVCGNEFKPNTNTRYIISGGYVCDWQCFRQEVKRKYEEKMQKNETKR